MDLGFGRMISYSNFISPISPSLDFYPSTRLTRLTPTGLFGQRVKRGRSILEQIRRGIKLDHPTVRQHYNSIVVQNRPDSVRNRQDSALTELSPDRLLNSIVRLHVHARACFVQDQHSSVAQKSASESNELSLAVGKVFATLLHFGLKFSFHARNNVFEIRGFERLPKLDIVVLSKRVEIRSDSSLEQNGICTKKEKGYD